MTSSRGGDAAIRRIGECGLAVCMKAESGGETKAREEVETEEDVWCSIAVAGQGPMGEAAFHVSVSCGHPVINASSDEDCDGEVGRIQRLFAPANNN